MKGYFVFDVPEVNGNIFTRDVLEHMQLETSTVYMGLNMLNMLNVLILDNVEVNK